MDRRPPTPAASDALPGPEGCPVAVEGGGFGGLEPLGPLGLLVMKDLRGVLPVRIAVRSR